MTDPQASRTQGGLPGPGCDRAGTGVEGLSRAGYRRSRKAGGNRDRRVVVCGGVRGVFARASGGRWVLENSEELGVLKGLGGSCDGVSRLQGMEAALAAGVAGGGDLVRLGRCLLSLASAKRVCFARVPDDLAAAVTVVCGWWEHWAAHKWLCWVLPLRLGGNLSGASGVGPGVLSWIAREEKRTPVRWPELDDGWLEELGDMFWERVRGHPEAVVRAAAEASDPKTPAGRLKVLAGAHGFEIGDIVASHPNTPARVLLRLARGYSKWPQWRAAQNTSAPPWVLARLAAAPPNSSPDSDPARRGLRQLARLKSTVPVRLRLWMRSMVPVRLRHRTSRQSTPTSRWLVAQNPAAPKRTLRRLARCGSVATRSWVACHPQTPRRALGKLASDDSHIVRRALCWNPSAPQRALPVLASDRRREVRAAAASYFRFDYDGLDRLAGDRSHEVRAAVAANPTGGYALLDRLAEDPHWRVRLSVAYQDLAGPHVLADLAADAHSDVRAAVALNDRVPAPTIGRLCDDADNRVAYLAAQHPQAPRRTLSRRAHSSDADDRWIAAAHRSCPPRLLQQLVLDSDPWVREEAAANPSTPLAALALSAKDENRRVRAAAAANPSAPDWLLERLADDDCVSVFKTAKHTLLTRTADPEAAGSGPSAKAS